MYIRLEYPKIQVLTDNGLLAVGYKIYTYVAGTATPVTTYSDRTLSTPNENPIVLNARAEADLFTNQAIKITITTDADVPVFTQDYLGEIISTFYTGTASGTTGNVYAVTASPIPSSLSGNMTVVFTPDVDSTDTMGATGFGVAAYNDCQISGPYTGSTSSTFRIEIDAAGATDTFKWRKDAGTWVTGVAITGNDQTLIEGITVDFAVLTGHTVGDYWTQAVSPPARLNLNALGAKLIYKNVGGMLINLEGGDLKADIPATAVYSSAQDCFILNNTADPVYSSLVPNRIRYQKTDDYTLVADDHGNEIDFVAAGNKVLTLPPAANFADRFVYIGASSTGNVTITANGTEKVYGRRSPGGSTTYVLLGSINDRVQLASNGIDWHIMTETLSAFTQQILTASGTYTKPFGVRYLGIHCYGPGGPGHSADYAGGGGGYSYKFINALSITTVTATVKTGADWGTTSFGTHCSATGGATGEAGGGGVGGTGADGDINLVGGSANGLWGGAGAGPLGGTSKNTGAGNFVGAGGSPNGQAGGNGLIILDEYR